MDLSNELRKEGWYLTEDGIESVALAADVRKTDPPNKILRHMISTALNMDFRCIAAGALPNKRDNFIPGRIVLQVQKVRNVSAPKANEDSKTAPRLLQVELSDGLASVHGLELERVNQIDLNIPPGTKIFFATDRLEFLQGYLVLRASEVVVLGGIVPPLVEKWEASRQMQKYVRSGRRVSGTSGPPQWVAFGQKTDPPGNLKNEANFKSLQAATKKTDDATDNEEFNNMRSEAIAVATKAGGKKIFGGGGQQIIDHNMKKILEKGYTEDEAKQSLRATNNNLERALYNLKRRQETSKRNDDDSQSKGAAPVRPQSTRGAMSKELSSKRSAATVKEEAAAAKPASNVSLFDFLTEKLPTNSNVQQTQEEYSQSTTYVAQKSEAKQNATQKFENNLSSSFAAKCTVSSQQNVRENARETRSGRNDYRTERTEQYERPYRPGRDSNERDERSSNSRFPLSNSDYRGRRYDRPSYAGPTEHSSKYESQGDRNRTRNRRNSRTSHERSDVSSSVGADARKDDYSNKYVNNYNRDEEHYVQSKGYEKPRYNQRVDTQSKSYDRNRQPSRYGSNRNNGMPATTSSSSGNNVNNGDQRVNTLTESHPKISNTKERERGGNVDQQLQRPRPKPQPRQQSEQPKLSQTRNSHRYSAPSHTQQTLHAGAPAQPNPQTTTPPQQQPQQNQSSYSQLPNGFSYDPSKIIGFQNKEANEYAINLLKSQGLLPVAMSIPQQQHQLQQQQHHGQPQPKRHIQSPLLPTPTMEPHQHPASHSYACGPPLQANASIYAAPTFIMSSPQQIATQVAPPQPPPPRFGMVCSETWNWKIGDVCLAKYWDDGRYYEAEITAISDKTCVVFFIGYGNHEEVLKSDCLPITDANHCPINSYDNPGPTVQVSQMSAVTPVQLHAGAFQRSGSGGGGGGSLRYRCERQVYVPPHKRENN